LDFLQGLAFSNKVCLVWITGHCGIYDNEEADILTPNEIKLYFCRAEVLSFNRDISEVVIQITLRLTWSLEYSSIENVAEKVQIRLEDFGGTYNLTLSFKQAPE
jgi:hypothetical protein